MTTVAPKLRSDLVMSRQGGFVVVKDPAAGRFFRFGEVDHFIASQCDGSTSVGEIRERTRQKFGAAPTPDVVVYFQLAFYSNVSDAWLFPEKSKRLWVTLAGPYVELVLWALAVLTWRFTNPDARLNAMALVVVATSGVRVFFNLNPLIKLDGYYLLSDALGIPNLRARAFGYVGGRPPRPLGAPARGGRPAGPRGRRVYLTYGLLAGSYSAWLLGVIAWALGRLFTGGYRGVGTVLSAGLPVAALQGRLGRWVSRSALAEAWRGRLAAVLHPPTARPAPGLPGGPTGSRGPPGP